MIRLRAPLVVLLPLLRKTLQAAPCLVSTSTLDAHYDTNYNLLTPHYNNLLCSTVREVKQEPQYVGGGIDQEAMAAADARIQQCTGALAAAQAVLHSINKELGTVREQKKRIDTDIQNLRNQEQRKEQAAQRLQTHQVDR